MATLKSKIDQIGLSLSDVGTRVIAGGQKILLNKKKIDTRYLFEHYDYYIKTPKKQVWELTFDLTDYGPYIDQGVQGINNKFNSPFTYRKKPRTTSGGKFIKNLEAWAVRHGMPASAAWGIRANIFDQGLKPTHFFTATLAKEKAAIDKIIKDAAGAWIEEEVEYVFD